MHPEADRAGAVPAPHRLLSEAQATRLRTVRAAQARLARAPRGTAGLLPGGPAAGPVAPHPWVHVICWMFRPSSKQYRAADRLLTVRQAGRQELADWSGLSAAAVSNMIKTLTDAGFEIRRRADPDRRVHFEVLGHERDRPPVREPGRAGADPPSRPAHVRYLGQQDGLAIVEIEGQGRFHGRFLGPVLPLSVLSGGAVLHDAVPGRNWLDLELGDRIHRVRLRVDGAGLDLRLGPWVS